MNSGLVLLFFICFTRASLIGTRGKACFSYHEPRNLSKNRQPITHLLLKLAVLCMRVPS